MQGLFVADSSWQNVHEALEAGGIAILPVAAACKEHGLHLPMNTDYVQAQWLCRRLADKSRVVIWPAVSYGYYPAFTDYPGSCSLSSGTFENMLFDIFKNILRVATRDILVINTGLSTISPLRAAIERSSDSGKIKLANIYDGTRVRSVIAQIEEQSNGSHADEIETSIMLAIAPHMVTMSAAVACACSSGSGPLSRTDSANPNYSPGGVCGDPRLASREKGELLAHAILDDLMVYL
jgi:creatinine amidohydrolase